MRATRYWNWTALVFLACLVVIGCSDENDESNDDTNSGGCCDDAWCFVPAGEDIMAICVDPVYERGGGTVILDAGEYRLTEPVHLYDDNLILQGQGAATLLKVGDDARIAAIVIGPLDAEPTGDHVENVVVRDLAIDGNMANQSGESWLAPYDYLNANGITVRRGRNVVLENLLIESCRSGGVVTEKGTENFRLSGSISRANYFDGYSCNETFNSQIDHNLFEDIWAAGITSSWQCEQNVFSNNQIINNGFGEFGADEDPGIWLDCASNKLFSGNVNQSSAGNGIWLLNNTAGARTDFNYFDGNRIADNAHYGIFMDKGDDSISGNVGHGTVYQGNGQGNLTTNDDLSQYRDIDPVEL